LLTEWALERLAAAADEPRLLVRYPNRLLPFGGQADEFATAHGYTAIFASTGLSFRQQYEEAIASAEVRKLLVVDQAPARRPDARVIKAPPPFYPDLLALVPPQARLQRSLRQFLQEQTGVDWPREAEEPAYARLIVRHLPAVLRTYQNLHAAAPGRFTDDDLHRVVAYAALGVPEAAFARLDAAAAWKIGLLGREALEELEALDMESVTRTVREALRAAPWPFSNLAGDDTGVVVHTFYLAAILAQHRDDWRLTLQDIDPASRAPAGADGAALLEAARDVATVQESLDAAAVAQVTAALRLNEPDGFAAALERERYSPLLRSLALLQALDNLLSGHADGAAQERVRVALAAQGPEFAVLTAAGSPTWAALTEVYQLAGDVVAGRQALTETLRSLGVLKPDQVNFTTFWQAWNGRRLNRLEYALSALERLLDTACIPTGPRSRTTPSASTLRTTQSPAIWCWTPFAAPAARRWPR